MADYGRVEFGGKWYTLTQDAWYSYTDAFGDVWYEASAVASNGDIYSVIWKATNPEAENEDEVCDWNNPYSVRFIEKADEEE